MYKDNLIKEAKEYIDILAHEHCHNCVDELGNDDCCEANDCILQKLTMGTVNLFGASIINQETFELFISKYEYEQLSKDELKRLTIYASRRFYANPRTLMRIAYFIIKNPQWLINVKASVPSILERIGFIKGR